MKNKFNELAANHKQNASLNIYLTYNNKYQYPYSKGISKLFSPENINKMIIEEMKNQNNISTNSDSIYFSNNSNQ